MGRGEGNYRTKWEIRTGTCQWGNTKNIKGEEEGLETDAERAKVPPMGSKEKVTKLGWQARTALTRHQWFKGSCWKDKEVTGVHGKAFSNSS